MKWIACRSFGRTKKKLRSNSQCQSSEWSISTGLSAFMLIWIVWILFSITHSEISDVAQRLTLELYPNVLSCVNIIVPSFFFFFFIIIIMRFDGRFASMIMGECVSKQLANWCGVHGKSCSRHVRLIAFRAFGGISSGLKWNMHIRHYLRNTLRFGAVNITILTVKYLYCGCLNCAQKRTYSKRIGSIVWHGMCVCVDWNKRITYRLSWSISFGVALSFG